MGEFDAVSQPGQPGAAGTVVPVLPFEFVNSLGRINEYTTANIGMNTYPWLTWNNRPFANRFELVNVPYTSPGWLTRLFSIPASVTGTVDAFSAFDHSGAGLEGTNNTTAGMPFALLPTAEQNKLKEVVHPNAFGFAHLLNFSADADESDRLAPVMDFVEVPSRFAGTFEYVDTTVFDDGSSSGWPDRDFIDYSLTAPFDELPVARYAGKVNLNTIPEERIWNSLLGSRVEAVPGAYATETTFDDLIAALEDSPLRPASAANYTSGTATGIANTGLFRSMTNTRMNGGMDASLLDYVPGTQQAFNNTDRNAFFRNGIRQKLGGVATNRSSVFAIWVTVGYFQWDPITNDFQPPTDPSFSSTPPEFGEEDGTVQRSRGFFIFDRSIPMAYEPGEDHNVDRGILLQSLIE